MHDGAVNGQFLNRHLDAVAAGIGRTGGVTVSDLDTVYASEGMALETSQYVISAIAQFGLGKARYVVRQIDPLALFDRNA